MSGLRSQPKLHLDARVETLLCNLEQQGLPPLGDNSKKREVNTHAFVSISRIADRCWCSSLAREYVHTNGTIDQIDFECRCGYRGCRVASECVWASKFHSKLPDWARLISS
jgi:hypothetical protein